MSALPRSLNCDGSLVLPKAESHSEWADIGNDEHEELARHDMAGRCPSGSRESSPKGARRGHRLLRRRTGVGRIAARARVATTARRDRSSSRQGSTSSASTATPLSSSTGRPDTRTSIRRRGTGNSGATRWLRVAPSASPRRASTSRTRTSPASRSTSTLRPFDLAEFASRLKSTPGSRSRLERVPRGVQPTTREGSWCAHCASKSRCPSKTACSSRSRKGLAIIGDTALTQDRAREAHLEIERLDQLVKEAKSRREKWIDENGPIDLGNGKAFGRHAAQG
jgi:hypothetical protein